MPTGSGISSKNLDGRIMKYDQVIVPAASVQTLFSVPYTLVTAQGAGTVLEFMGAFATLNFKSAAYVVGATADLAIRYTNASGAIVSTTLETTGFLDQTTSQLRSFKAITTDYTPVANTPLVLALLNANITTGDSPLFVYITYKIHKIYI